MKIRTIGLVVVLLVGVTIVSAGCGKKTPPAATEGAGGGMGAVEETIPEAGTGQMTDELYVELMARQYYEIEKNPVWIGEGWTNLLRENGLTESQFSAFIDEISTDATRFMDLSERVAVRLDELRAGKEEKPKKEEPVAKEKTPVEKAFDRAKDVEISSAKAKGVDEALRPVLKGVFDSVVDEKVIVGVKMKEEFGPMLTYAFNRKLTEVERDAILSGLEAAGFENVDNAEKIVTVKKGSEMWVITFFLNDEQKSGLELTF